MTSQETFGDAPLHLTSSLSGEGRVGRWRGVGVRRIATRAPPTIAGHHTVTLAWIVTVLARIADLSWSAFTCRKESEGHPVGACNHWRSRSGCPDGCVWWTGSGRCSDLA